MLNRSRSRLFAALLVLPALLMAAAPGAAHVNMGPKQVSPGEFSNLAIYVYHGCETAPTTGLTVRVPEGVGIVRPNMKAGWKITTESAVYPKPIEAYGVEYKEGFVVLNWTGGSTPAEYMDTFIMSAFFPNTPGKTLRFLVEQRCEGVSKPETFVQEINVGSAVPRSGAAPAPAKAAEPTPAASSPGSGAAPLLSILSVLISVVALALALRRRF